MRRSTDELRALVAPAEAIFLDAKTESELIELPSRGIGAVAGRWRRRSPGWTSSRGSASPPLGLQTFLTAGRRSHGAWTIKRGATAPQAAGVIHPTSSALHQGRGRVLRRAGRRRVHGRGPRPAARCASEGKDYVMADGERRRNSDLTCSPWRPSVSCRFEGRAPDWVTTQPNNLVDGAARSLSRQESCTRSPTQREDLHRAGPYEHDHYFGSPDSRLIAADSRPSSGKSFTVTSETLNRYRVPTRMSVR